MSAPPEKEKTLSIPDRFTRAAKAALSHLQTWWHAHIRLLQDNPAYEAIWVALFELLLQQRVNLHRLITQIFWTITRRWPRPQEDY